MYPEGTHSENVGYDGKALKKGEIDLYLPRRILMKRSHYLHLNQ